MALSQSTKTLLSQVNTVSGGTLQRSMDMGVLLETAQHHSLQTSMDDLAFLSKFLIKSFELMKRIGKGGEGYDKLEKEFTVQTERSRAIISLILEKADPMTQTHFRETYLSMETISLQNLMQLFHDLSWYKNYQLDQQ
jgi:hypothetical protein